jgi:hypothetical protein
MRGTRWAWDQALRISLRIGIFLGVFAIQAENGPRICT